MKDLTTLDRYRLRTREVLQRFGTYGDKDGGCFEVECKKNGSKIKLAIIASRGEGWDHVSVSLHNRAPTWEEMELVKRLFFEENELAIQYHMPPSKHINIHPDCLHIWRPHFEEIPTPPTYLV